MPVQRPWATPTLRYGSLTTLLLLVVQYVLGLWTNAYSVGDSFPGTLTGHIAVGYLLGVLSLLLLMVVVLDGRKSLVGPSALLLLSVALAGVTGRLFLMSNATNAGDSVAMGVAFLAAFASASMLVFSAWRSSAAPSSPTATTAPA